jgi:nicotinate-nucleotide pyrophosphorylase (carboxylating)
MNLQDIQRNVTEALREDLAGLSIDNDITANLIPEDHVVKAQVITREDCVLAGKAWAEETVKQVDDNIKLQWTAEDGDKLNAGQTIFSLHGKARSILTAERTALNFLQTLCSTATITARYVKILEGSNITLLDTRKTIPGLRAAQKYAVTCGGGKNHRIGLFDAFLIKENHIMACGSILAAVLQARAQAPNKAVEVEVENLDELEQALAAGADIVMLDNFQIADLYKATAMNGGRSKLEVSGNITEQKLQELRDTGIDFISSGALTKNIQAIDLSMRII